jgi:hypothetical protein
LDTAYYNQTFGPNQWAEADVVWTPGAGIDVPTVRNNGGDLYDFWFDGTNHVQINKRIGGSYSTVGTSTTVAPTTFKARLEAQGTTLRAYVDGTLVLTTTDSSIASGQPGLLGANGTGGSADNWNGGDLPYDLAAPQPPLAVLGPVGGGGYATGANGSAITCPNWSVTAGDLLVVAVGACGGPAGQASQWSLTGGGLTWTRRVEANQSGVAYCSNAAIFTAVAASTTTISNLNPVHANCLQTMYALYRVTGYLSATPVGATAALADNSTDGQKDITLSATPAASSTILAFAFVNMADSNSTKKIDHGASDGWTERFDFGPSMTAANMWGCWEGQAKNNHGLTRVRWDDILPAGVTAASYSFAGAAIEIKSA